MDAILESMRLDQGHSGKGFDVVMHYSVGLFV